MKNEQVDALIAELTALEDTLYDRGLSATSDADREKIRLEYNAVNTRTLRLQAKLFAAATQDISSDVAAIQDATKDVKKAIKEVEDLNGALGGIANLLGIVDKVLGFFP